MNPNLSSRDRRIVAQVERLLSHRTDRILAVSPEEVEHLTDIGISPDRVALVPNGITPITTADRDEVRRALVLPEEATIFGFVGRLDDQKAPLILLEGFEAINSEHPDAHLAIVGAGPLKAEVEKARNASAHPERIHLLGEQPGRWAMAAFDVFVLPSWYEGFPYVLIEAAQSGLPIITSDRACAIQLIPDDQHGRVVPAGDPSALANAMATLTDPSERSTLAEAVKIIGVRFTVEAMANGVASATPPRQTSA